jgi:hypothetical protein
VTRLDTPAFGRFDKFPLCYYSERKGVQKMKSLIISLTLVFSSMTFAENMSLKGVDVEKDTEIRIHHGASTSNIKYEIFEDSSTVEGEPSVLDNESRQNWRAACNIWKKDRPDGAQLLTADCGAPECTKANYQTICSSVASRKLRVRMQE